MSILGDILSGIFGRSHPSPTGADQPTTGTQINPTAHPQFPASGSGAQQPAQQASQPGLQQGTQGGSVKIPFAPRTAPQQHVDVEAVLDRRAAEKKAKLDWRHSIVDLMKLLDLDSGLSARKELAKELYYGGDTNDSAAMNIWLHKQVMTKLAENGGKVPESLKH